MAQLVVPLHPLAHHGRLVEGLLRPVDAAVARTPGVSLRDGRPSGAEKHGHIGPRRVDDAPNGVGGAGNRMHHHHLRAPGDHGIAVGHAHGGHLMGHRNGARRRQFLHLSLGVSLDKRREIRPAVTEEVIYSSGGQQLQISLCNTLHRGMVVHFKSSQAGLIDARIPPLSVAEDGDDLVGRQDDAQTAGLPDASKIGLHSRRRRPGYARG